MASAPVRVVIELPSENLTAGSVVLAAALSLFDDDAEIVVHLCGVNEPTEQHAMALSALCHDLVPAGARMADIVLLGSDEAIATEHQLAVESGRGDMADARAVILLAALADLLHTPGAEPAVAPTGHPEPYGASLRRTLLDRIRAVDDEKGPRRPPVVVAVAQVQSTWSALDSVCQALQARDDVRLEVVALGSAAEERSEGSADFLRALGYRPRDLAWFERALAEGEPIDLVLFDNPYDALRPDSLRSTTLASRGIRTALSPYGNNNIATTPEIASMLYDSPMHRLAWRLYVRSEGQRLLFERHCAVGAAHVRVLGLPKLDRVVTAIGTKPSGRIAQIASGRPVVLWNPHFSVHENGWSTFDRYLAPMIDYFAAHPEGVLVVRPHFRLAHDAAVVGGPLAAMMSHLADAVRVHENILLDDDADYLPAFQAASVFVSDLSSLITEFLPTGKPVLYLHRQDGPGVNQDAEYLLALDVATAWPTVQSFLDDAVSGVDRSADRRRLVLDRHFPRLDGRSGERIADDLVQSFVAETASSNAAVRQR
jgi:hypothetical protein